MRTARLLTQGVFQGVLSSRGVLSDGGAVQGAGGAVQKGVVPSRGCCLEGMLSITGSDIITPPPTNTLNVDRQRLLKISPCPKLCLRAVIIAIVNVIPV